MSEPVPAMTQLFRISLRTWQARWKAAQEPLVAEPVAVETASALVAPEAEPAAKVSRRRKRSGRKEQGPVAHR
jgi:hypothetical protein